MKTTNPWNKVFPKTLSKKIEKTAEARSGKGIYKRRNNRNYRVIMHLSTYRYIDSKNSEFLSNFENGFAIRISPEEFFTSDVPLPDSVVLGKNAFVYYKTISSFKKFPPNADWNEITELYTSNKPKPENEPEWIGEYALFINNAKPSKISRICGKAGSLTSVEKQILKDNYSLENVPSQAGLGNFDYDYATKDETTAIKYQLSYFMLKVNGMKEYLNDLCQSDLVNKTFGFSPNAYKSCTQPNGFSTLYDTILEDITKYCENHDLLDFEKLIKIRAWGEAENQPVCPLCLQTLNAQDFLEVAEQVNGREEEDNTRSKIALMHIHALRPGELNHRVYNLGWGHRHCNTIQEDYDIEEILNVLRLIVDHNSNELLSDETLPVDDLTVTK